MRFAIAASVAGQGGPHARTHPSAWVLFSGWEKQSRNGDANALVFLLAALRSEGDAGRLSQVLVCSVDWSLLVWSCGRIHTIKCPGKRLCCSPCSGGAFQTSTKGCEVWSKSRASFCC